MTSPSEDEIFSVLRDFGLKLKVDLWKEQDIDLLRRRSKDLVGLKNKFDSTTDPGKKAEYQLAAELSVNHVQLLALARLGVAQQHVLEALEKLCGDILMPALSKLLIGLIVAG